ncbi:MAG: hypothetical protein K8953_07670, partial [Proteobacteria bacterium]|nr:hypothetical protein [Pseudomonadota bacterium]
KDNKMIQITKTITCTLACLTLSACVGAIEPDNAGEAVEPDNASEASDGGSGGVDEAIQGFVSLPLYSGSGNRYSAPRSSDGNVATSLPNSVATRVVNSSNIAIITRNYLASLNRNISDKGLYVYRINGGGKFTKNDGILVAELYEPGGGFGHAYAWIFGSDDNNTPNVGAALTANASFSGRYFVTYSTPNDTGVKNGNITLQVNYIDGTLKGRSGKLEVDGHINRFRISGFATYNNYLNADLGGYAGVNGAIGVFRGRADFNSNRDYAVAGGFVVH